MTPCRHWGRAALACAVLAAALGQAHATSDGYSIGLNFGADEPNAAGTGALNADEIAGVPAVAQGNWNNLSGVSGLQAGLVADDQGSAVDTATTVDWTASGTWSSTGRGEENNGFPDGPDRDLMTGYLDTGDDSITFVTISDIPADLTSGGYNVYVYALGGVPARGGGYRVTDLAGNELAPYQLVSSPTNPDSYIQDTGESHDETGNYVVFKGLTADGIVIEASTSFDFDFNDLGTPAGTQRAPINAIQLAQAPDTLVLISASASSSGFELQLADSGAAVADLDSINLTLNGETVTGSADKSAEGITTVTYNAAEPFPSGADLEVTVDLEDTQDRAYSFTQTLATPTYVTLAPSARIDESLIDTSERGFLWRVHQADSATTLPNTLARTEAQLAGEYGDNIADTFAIGGADDVAQAPSPATAPMTFEVSNVINFSQLAGDALGNFTPDLGMPGIPGMLFTTDNIAAEILTALEFPEPGIYTMIVNSDDGHQRGAEPAESAGEPRGVQRRPRRRRYRVPHPNRGSGHLPLPDDLVRGRRRG